MLVMYFWKAL